MISIKQNGGINLKIFGSNNSKISIDFGSSVIKVVEGEFNKGVIKIAKSSIFNIDEDTYRDGRIFDLNGIADYLNDNLKISKLSNNFAASAVINSSSIITREITIPIVSTKEIKSIIDFQLSDFLPVNPDDYVVNHLIVGSIEDEGVEKYRIVLIAIPNEIVLCHLELMKKTDLRPKVLDFQANSIAKLLNHNNIINENYDLNYKTVASIDIGHMSTNITIIKEGNMEVTRTFELGVRDLYNNLSDLLSISIEDTEKKVHSIADINSIDDELDEYHNIINLTRMFNDDLIESVQSVFRYYISRCIDNKIDLIILQGGYSNLNGICKVFKDNLDIVCLKLNGLDNVNFKGDLSLYANAIGGLIRLVEVDK